MGLKFNPFTGALDQVAVVNQGDFNDLFIDANGKVGIGTTSPSAPLEVESSEDILIRAESTDRFAHIDLVDNAATTRFTTDGATGTLRLRADNGNAATGSTIQFEIDGSEHARIDSSGRLGLGTSTPGSFNAFANQLVVGTGSGSNGITIFGGTSSNLSFADGTSGDESYAGYLAYNHSNDSLSFYVNYAGSNGATPRMHIDSSGYVGIGTTTPGNYGKLAVFGAATNSGQNISGFFYNPDAASATICIQDNTSGAGAGIGSVGNNLVLYSGSGVNLIERARIDSSGRLLVGTNTTSAACTTIFQGSSAGATGGGSIILARGEATPADGAAIGSVFFSANNHVQAANIYGARDGGTWTAGSSQPSRLVFSTTADGASSPTARAIIDSSGRLLVGTSTARTVAGAARNLQIEGTNGPSSAASIFRNTNDASGPQITFGKSRGTSNGSNTLVNSGDSLGSISFSGADGSDADSRAALITAEVDGTPGANDMPGRLVFSTTADGASSPTERLRIDSSGNVGIGTSSPNYKLEVAPDANRSFGFDTDGTFSLILRNTSTNAGADLGFDTKDSILFKTDGAERARIDSSTRLLVGTSSSSANTRVVIAGRSDGNQAGTLLMQGTSTTPANGNTFGLIRFSASNPSGSNGGAEIYTSRDGGTWTNNSSMPTRLVFATTADGASSTTERMRIKSDGTINFSNVAVYADNAAAKTGGLVDGDVYRTSTGDLKIVYT